MCACVCVCERVRQHCAVARLRASPPGELAGTNPWWQQRSPFPRSKLKEGPHPLDDLAGLRRRLARPAAELVGALGAVGVQISRVELEGSAREVGLRPGAVVQGTGFKARAAPHAMRGTRLPPVSCVLALPTARISTHAHTRAHRSVFPPHKCVPTWKKGCTMTSLSVYRFSGAGTSTLLRAGSEREEGRRDVA